MSTRPSFDITPHYERYLPTEGSLVDVIATVRGSRSAGPGDQPDAAGPQLAEVIMLDCSGSMGAPATKLFQARRAAASAIDALRDGVHFAVVAGTHRAEMIYPNEIRLVAADARRREAAKQALRRIGAGGGTAMSTWLQLARRLFTDRADAIRHAILLTDGKNESEPLATLEEALAECAGRYTVDCRAISDRPGVDTWRGTELLRIADALGANPVVPVADLDRLASEFTDIISTAMNQRVGDVRLRVRTSALATVRFVKQVHPTIADLGDLAQRVDEQTTDYPIGAWGDGHRDYHVGLSVQPMAAGETRRVGWLSLLVPRSGEAGTDAADEVGQSAVSVEWTEDIARYTGINPTVAHYTRQHELAGAIRAAWEAFDQRRLAEAETLMGRAVALAYQAGAHDKLAVFARVVEIRDAAAGQVRLRPDVDAGHWQVPTVTGHHTQAWGTAGPADVAGMSRGVVPVPAEPEAPVPDEPCPNCQTRRRGRFCERCRYDFVSGAATGGR
ncbi:VWA domain-containing protein [Micromonospora sonneratiae]|uniref:VWA domain-containing protein n=1 Tax=Micromonospora sonneratiae TaxID=1184706 RepID=A0ABW3Y771_9ACTN